MTTLRTAILGALRAGPMAATAVCAALPEHKPQSVKAMLSNMAAAGVLTFTPGATWREAGLYQVKLPGLIPDASWPVVPRAMHDAALREIARLQRIEAAWERLAAREPGIRRLVEQPPVGAPPPIGEPDLCDRCGAALNNLRGGWYAVPGGCVCGACVRPGEWTAQARGL